MEVKKKVIQGFSKLPKEEKINLVAGYFTSSDDIKRELISYWHSNPDVQKLFDEFSENTITNFYFPYGIAPNFLINNKIYMVPMVIEESSVVAAASSSAKFWAAHGGFHSKVISTVKVGQVHFFWKGDEDKLKEAMPVLKKMFYDGTEEITANMRKRGGGILDIELVNMTHQIPNYYQVKASFETRDSMGANFINSVLEDFAAILKNFLQTNSELCGGMKECEVIMAILSNYTPECLVKSWVECPVSAFDSIDEEMTGEKFAKKFEKAVQIANVDVFRATTHNKGIFNGIDAVILATGNDFRAIEAGGHTFASRSGRYQSLTSAHIQNGTFRYELLIPLAVGTVGGLTRLHPMSKISLELLGNPDAIELMNIISSVGLANNFAALRSLITKGIQSGHMKMHLLNILNFFDATHKEKILASEYFKNKKVSFNSVSIFIDGLRNGNH